MKFLLRLVLFAGVLTSLDGVDGMIPKVNNDQPPQITNVNEDWTQEEKDWGVDRILDYIKDIYGNLSPFADAVCRIPLWMEENEKKIQNFSTDYKTKYNPEDPGHLSKFIAFLLFKGYFRLQNADCGQLVPTKKISETELRGLFTSFKNLKNDYNFLIQTSDLTKSESPFIRWLSQYQNVVQFIRDEFATDSVESWNDFCALQSQFSCGFKVPTRKASK